MEMNYIKVYQPFSCVICPDCGAIVHADYIGHHNAFHLRLLRGTLQKKGDSI